MSSKRYTNVTEWQQDNWKQEKDPISLPEKGASTGIRDRKSQCATLQFFSAMR